MGRSEKDFSKLPDSLFPLCSVLLVPLGVVYIVFIPGRIEKTFEHILFGLRMVLLAKLNENKIWFIKYYNIM